MLLLGYPKTCLWHGGIRCDRQKKKKKKKGRPRCIFGRPRRPWGLKLSGTIEVDCLQCVSLLTRASVADAALERLQGRGGSLFARPKPPAWPGIVWSRRPRVGLEMLLRGQLWEQKADDRLQARGRSHHCERICPHFSNVVSLRKTHLREDIVAK